MNERIRELIGPAQKEVWGNNPYNGSPEFEGYELDVEKFAELIVRECAEVCRLKYARADAWSKECSLNFSKDVLNHFGVEE